MKELEKIISYFKEISKIPRTSGDEKAISDYLVQFAKERNLEAIQDQYNNVIIKKPAFPGEEHRRTLVFQGHIDMVYVKKEESSMSTRDQGLKFWMMENFFMQKIQLSERIMESQFAMH